MSQDLPFPQSLPEFQRLFKDDTDCAAYMERCRWRDGFVCPECHEPGEPFRFSARPQVLRCRKCERDISLMAGTVMQGSHTPLLTWFWGAYLVTSQIPGISAVQFQRQLGLGRYETAFQILHKLRQGMVRPDADRIGGQGSHVEADDTWVGGQTVGEGHGVHHQTLVVGAVEVRQRKPKEAGPFGEQSKAIPRRGGRYAGRLRLAVVPNRGGKALTGFVRSAVDAGTMIVTDDGTGYRGLAALGYQHLPVAERGDPRVTEEYLPILHLIFSNLKAWLLGVHHGRVEPHHLQAYLNEFTFRFNRRFYPFNAFRSLLGLAGDCAAPTYDELYSGEWRHPTCVAAGGG